MSCKIRISYDATELSKKGDETKDKIAEAVLKTAYIIRKNAITNLKSSPYKMDKVADKGILVGKLKKDQDSTNIKVHAFGNQEEGLLARIFIPGTKERVTRDSRARGYIKPNPAIDKAASDGSSILESEIKKVI